MLETSGCHARTFWLQPEVTNMKWLFSKINVLHGHLQYHKARDLRSTSISFPIHADHRFVWNVNHKLIVANHSYVQTFTVVNEDTSLIIIISGSIIGSLCIVIVLITTTFIVAQAIVIRSNRALRQQLRLSTLKENLDQQAVIYEEIPQRRESRKISIETGDNSAYMSTTGYKTVYK